jgi:hypothetical protein
MIAAMGLMLFLLTHAIAQGSLLSISRNEGDALRFRVKVTFFEAFSKRKISRQNETLLFHERLP